jgi:thioredoxin reductase
MHPGWCSEVDGLAFEPGGALAVNSTVRRLIMQHDAIVVGGSFAGLAAATYLARARRSVCVLDTRRPRNRFAEASHGFLSQDGSRPETILDAARAQLLVYPTTTMIEREAVEAQALATGFAVKMTDGAVVEGRQLILAFGLRDVLPAIPGLQERWGKTVLHCPYCHGYEFADQRLGVLYSSPMSVHQTLLISEWGPTTIYLNGADLPAESRTKLHDRGVGIEAGSVRALEGLNGRPMTVVLDDGRNVTIDALFVGPQSCLSSPLAEQLGAAVDIGPIGPIIRTDADQQTTLAGVYAAGDIARAPHSVSWAVADGVTAGTAAHRALVFG